MKRTEALSVIRHCGFNDLTDRAAVIAAQKGINKAAVGKAYTSGQKDKALGLPCGCTSCNAKRGEK